jgi:pimeloyl-ACP methyl ester carboxylesterase
MAVVGDARTRQFVSVAGRRLCFAEWGDRFAAPVISIHGTPGSRLNRHSTGGAYAELCGAHVITYDRPGYGASDRQPGRAVVDCAADVAAIADHLGLAQFAVTGSSGGGPHALAVAARLGDRVTRARCHVGLAPFGRQDLPFFEGMDPLNVKEFGWALESEARLTAELTRELAQMGERVEQDATQLVGPEWALDDADRAVMARSDVAQFARESTRDLVSGGVLGWVDDDLCFVRPWGFQVTDIAVPVRVSFGLRDVLSPPSHGAWLARNIPRAEVVVDEQSGHMSSPDDVTRALRWLVAGDGS